MTSHPGAQLPSAPVSTTTDIARRRAAMANHRGAQQMERVNNPYVQVRGPHPQPSTPVQYTTVYGPDGVVTPMQYLADPNNDFDIQGVVGNENIQNINKQMSAAGAFIGNDKNTYTVSPEYRQYLNAVDPMFYWDDKALEGVSKYEYIKNYVQGGKEKADAAAKEAYMNKEQVTQRVTENLTKMYQDQGLIEKFGGFKNFNSKIQEGINNELQYGMALKRRGDPRGDQYIQHAKACQYAFNQAQPKVNQAWNTQMTAMKNKAKDFAKNNWWWMVPGGLLMMAGLFNRGNNAKQAPQQPYDPFATPKAWQGVNMQGLTFNNEQQLAKPKTQG